MKHKMALKIENVEKAFNKLNEFLLIQNPSEAVRAGVIQAFEFTFELFWKTFKTRAELEGLKVASPKSALSYAFHAGIIENEEVWLDMLEKRNLTVHTYNENEAKLIFDSIHDKFWAEFRGVLVKLKV